MAGGTKKNNTNGHKAPSATEAEPGARHKPEPEEGDTPVAKRTRASGKASEVHVDETHQTDEKKPEGKREQRRQEASPAEKERKKTDDSHEKKAKPHASHGGAAVSPGGRDAKPPSNLLEKGIIYFFFRGRVGREDEPPHAVSDISRSYMILRPIAKDASLGEDEIGDAGNTRLLALPKKVLPRSGRDRFMAWVEKSGASFKQLRDEFLGSSDYETKTKGVRHAPAATPFAEGVYAMTATGRESHLAYILTLPEKLGEVQTKMGLKDRGSFIITTKNPKCEGLANARFKKKPEYPKQIITEFRSLRWLPSRPQHLDYPNTQLLFIGESSGLEKAMDPQEDNGKSADTEEPLEKMEMLEDEDVSRMEHLGGSDSAAIYADLQVNAAGYPKLQTTF